MRRLDERRPGLSPLVFEWALQDLTCDPQRVEALGVERPMTGKP
jgi:hypothetical protein